MKEASLYYIPFTPGFNNSGYIDTRTISPNATRYTISEDPAMLEYYLHNGNSLMFLK